MRRKDIMVAAAHACLGTPFHHQGRAGNVGLDCIGLVIHAMRAAGYAVNDDISYARSPKAGQLEEALRAHGFQKIGAEDAEAGDVLLFRMARQPQHVGLLTSLSQFVHAYAPVGRVVESGLGETWLRRVAGIYQLPD